MTQSERKQMTQKSLTSFQKFFNNSKTETIVPEPLGPSSLQSSSVEAYIDLEENELSDEELLQTLQEGHKEMAAQQGSGKAASTIAEQAARIRGLLDTEAKLRKELARLH